MTAFNPFDHISTSASDSQTSISSLINETVGQCPKCKGQMGTALVEDDTVFYCPPCRVTTPMPTQQG